MMRMVTPRSRICVISKQDPCSPGGVESVVHGILRELEGHEELDVQVTYYGKGKECQTAWTSVPYRGMRPKLLNPLVYGAVAGADVIAGRFRVVNAHAEAGFGYGLLHRLFGRRKDTLFIQTFHGVSWYMVKSFQCQLGGSTKLLSWIYRPLVAVAEGIAARTADIVVVVSEGVGEELVELYGVDRKRIKVIHNTVDTERFIPRDKGSAKKRLGLEENTPYLLYVGKEHVRKGLQTAVSACEELRREGQPAVLLIAGLRPDQLPDYARNEGVRALGRVSEGDLPFLYNAASVLVHPSKYEGHPITPLESLASGTPVVASKESKVELPPSPAIEIVMSGRIEDYVEALKRSLALDTDAMAMEARGAISGYSTSYSEYYRMIQEWDRRIGGGEG